MKKLLVLVALLILGCTKEQLYSVKVETLNNATKVELRASEPMIIELDLSEFKDTIFVNKLPQIRVYEGTFKVKSRRLNGYL